MTMNLPPIYGMYAMMTGKSDDWGLDGYEVTKRYEDHNKLKQQRTGSVNQIAPQKKAKKGHYLDDLARESISPGPKYDTSQSMMLKNRSSAVEPTKKKTYIDQVINSARKHKFPSPNTYRIMGNLQIQSQKSKKIGAITRRYGDTINFVTSSQFESLKSPGPGQYNPHQIRTPLRQNHYNPKQLRQIDEVKLKKYQSVKTIGHPYNPISRDTFAQRTLLPKKFEQNKSRIQNQIKQVKKRSKKVESKIPGPGQYDVINQWRGKGQTTKRNLHNSLSFGISSKVYY